MSDDSVRPLSESVRSIIHDHTILSGLDGSSATFGYHSDKRSHSNDLKRGHSEARMVEKLVARVAKVIRSYRLRAQAQRHSPISVTAEAIRKERGRPATELAFIYGWELDAVELKMLEAGLDPKTGEPKERALTAPADEALRGYLEGT